MAKNMDYLAFREQFDYIPASGESAWGLYVTGVDRLVELRRKKVHNHTLSKAEGVGVQSFT